MKKDRNFELCETICKLDDNILGSALLDKGMIIAGFSKPGVTVPNEERFAKILFQLELITSLHRENEDFYGMLKYHTVQYAESSLFVFPTDKYGSEKPLILTFKASRPHSHDKNKLSSRATSRGLFWPDASSAPWVEPFQMNYPMFVCQ